MAKEFFIKYTKLLKGDILAIKEIIGYRAFIISIKHFSR